MTTKNLLPLVICGPSGVGKGTMISKLMKDHPTLFGLSCSHTTRKAREGEVDGVHYHFVGLELMNDMIRKEEFVEYANVHTNVYGTSKKAIQHVRDTGKICILDIDVQGAENVKKAQIPAKYVFIAPPSMEILEDRLRKRGTETEETIAVRMNTAKREMEFVKKEGFFDVVIVNDDLDKTYDELKKWIFQNCIVTP